MLSDVVLQTNRVPDVFDDLERLIQDRHPPFAFALGNVGAEPDEPVTLEVLAPEPPKFLVPGTGAHAKNDDPPLSCALARIHHRDDLMAGESIDAGFALLCLANLPSRVRLAYALLHSPVVERDENRVGIPLRVGMLPATQRTLDVVATD